MLLCCRSARILKASLERDAQPSTHSSFQRVLWGSYLCITPSVAVKHVVSSWKVQQVFNDNYQMGKHEEVGPLRKSDGHIIYTGIHPPVHPSIYTSHPLNKYLFSWHPPQPLSYMQGITKVQWKDQREHICHELSAMPFCSQWYGRPAVPLVGARWFGNVV